MLPTPATGDVRQLSIEGEPESGHVMTLGVGRLKLAINARKTWSNGRKLNVRFLNGTPTQRHKTMMKAKLWEEWANIVFEFNDSPSAELRVSFKDDRLRDTGSWSYIGTDALAIPQNKSTIHFGWLDDNTADAEYERVVLHEFGHALGCLHEDQQPAAKIAWDKDAVYRYFMSPPNNFTKNEVHRNVLDVIPEHNTNHTDFDGTSIMAYAIPPEFTLDKKGVPGGSTLSPMDKIFIGRIYPKKVTVQPTWREHDMLGNRRLSTENKWTDGEFIDDKPCIYDMNVKSNGKIQIITDLNCKLIKLHSEQSADAIAESERELTAYLTSGDYFVLVFPNANRKSDTFKVIARYMG